ncbi:MAG: hypothetical protein Q7T21_01045 [Gallionella sp.]|nr:hypothetical protein [Gallionella sp.]
MAIRQEWMTLQPDWDQSGLGTYLLYDYWSPDDGLCILTGFDFLAHRHGTPYQLGWTSTLSPGTFQGHACQQDEYQAIELLDRMQGDLIHLSMIWANSRRDTEAEGYPPAFFIEWALSKSFTPDWLDWAIGTGRYTQKDELGEAGSPDLDKVRFTTPPELPIESPLVEGCTGGNSTLAFQEMTDLNASELALAFVGDKPESGLGANNMLQVSARGQKRRIPLAALDLVNKRKGTPNGECGILLGLTQGFKPKNSSANTQKMKRLRNVFLHHFGISKDPFEPYLGATGWVPLFKIEDRRGLADERAKKEAEERMVSLEQLAEKGIQQSERSNDDADDWMKENGHRL